MLGVVWLDLLGQSGQGAEGLEGKRGVGTARCGEEAAGGICSHGYRDVKGN